jgi:hypothetical protein
MKKLLTQGSIDMGGLIPLGVLAGLLFMSVI